MKKALYLGLVALLGLGVALAIQAGSDEQAGKFFPAAGIDLIHHELQVGIYKVNDDGSNGDLLERLLFEGRMLVERSDPYVNAGGFRQIDFLVKDWKAMSWSDTLDTMVMYYLSDGIQQEFSSITAQQKGSDYPAKFDFRVGFTATAFGETVIDPFHGNPYEEGFFEVPPSGNRRTSPTMYGFETERIETDHPAHGRLRFVPLACNDSDGQTLTTFDPDSPARDKRLRRDS